VPDRLLNILVKQEDAPKPDPELLLKDANRDSCLFHGCSHSPGFLDDHQIGNPLPSDVRMFSIG